MMAATTLLCALAGWATAATASVGEQPALTIIEISAHGPGSAARLKALAVDALRAQGMAEAEANSIASDVAEMASGDSYPVPVETPRGRVCLAVASDGGLKGLVQLLPGGRNDPLYEIFIALTARHEAAHCEMLRDVALDSPPLADDSHWFEEARADAAALKWAEQTFPDRATTIRTYWRWHRFFGFLSGATEHWGSAITDALISGGDTSIAAAHRLHADWDGHVTFAQMNEGWKRLTQALRASPDSSAAQQAAWDSALQYLPPRLTAVVPSLEETRHLGQRLCPASADWRMEVLKRRYHRC